MSIREPFIKDYMTLQPQTVESTESIENAAKLMVKFKIRHLPVVHEGIVTGLLSERDLNFAIGIESVDPRELLVADVCSDRPYIVHPETALREVANIMAKKCFGSAIVMENARLIGIFTTIDACRALHDLLEHRARGRDTRKGGAYGRL